MTPNSAAARRDCCPVPAEDRFARFQDDDSGSAVRPVGHFPGLAGLAAAVWLAEAGSLRWPGGRGVLLHTKGFGAVRTLMGAHPDAGPLERRAARGWLGGRGRRSDLRGPALRPRRSPRRPTPTCRNLFRPEAADARVVAGHVVKMPKATFSQVVGTDNLRPGQRTSVPKPGPVASSATASTPTSTPARWAPDRGRADRSTPPPRHRALRTRMTFRLCTTHHQWQNRRITCSPRWPCCSTHRGSPHRCATSAHIAAGSPRDSTTRTSHLNRTAKQALDGRSDTTATALIRRRHPLHYRMQ